MLDGCLQTNQSLIQTVFANPIAVVPYHQIVSLERIERAFGWTGADPGFGIEWAFDRSKEV